jgi:hypothetical protein
MYQTVELVLKSYMPKHIEPGMWFISKFNMGTVKELSEIWTITKPPAEPLEKFITKHGAPVEPYLIYNEQVVAEPHEIGWWDEGENTDELRDIELKDINIILNDFDGFVDIEIDDWDFHQEGEISPVLYADKVTICIPDLYEEEDDDDDDEAKYEEYDMDDDTWNEN